MSRGLTLSDTDCEAIIRFAARSAGLSACHCSDEQLDNWLRSYGIAVLDYQGATLLSSCTAERSIVLAARVLADLIYDDLDLPRPRRSRPRKPKQHSERRTSDVAPKSQEPERTKARAA